MRITIKHCLAPLAVAATLCIAVPAHAAAKNAGAPVHALVQRERLVTPHASPGQVAAVRANDGIAWGDATVGLAVGLGLSALIALGATRKRALRRLATRVTFTTVGISATLVLVAGAMAPRAVAAQDRADKVPSSLIGTWTRTITAADVAGISGARLTPGTSCTFTVRPSGAASIACSGVRRVSGSIDAAGPARIRTTLGPYSGSLYRWSLSGARLTVTMIEEAAADPGVDGVWHRVGPRPKRPGSPYWTGIAA
jgi:hypothetical protein